MDRLSNKQKSIFRTYIKTICDQTLWTLDELDVELKSEMYLDGTSHNYSYELLKEYVQNYVDSQLAGELECSYTLHAVSEYIYNEGVNWIPDYLQDLN